MSDKKNKLHFSTKSIHVGNKIDETGAVVTPIHFTSTFRNKNDCKSVCYNDKPVFTQHFVNTKPNNLC